MCVRLYQGCTKVVLSSDDFKKSFNIVLASAGIFFNKNRDGNDYLLIVFLTTIDVLNVGLGGQPEGDLDQTIWFSRGFQAPKVAKPPSLRET